MRRCVYVCESAQSCYTTPHQIHAELKTKIRWKKSKCTTTLILARCQLEGITGSFDRSSVRHSSIHPCSSQTSTVNRMKRQSICTYTMIDFLRAKMKPTAQFLRIGPPRTSNLRNLPNFHNHRINPQRQMHFLNLLFCLVRRVINVIIFHCCRCRSARPKVEEQSVQCTYKCVIKNSSQQ